ncbi:YecA family protein [Desulfotruncus alcoholivorax]|uniref:YecA family protein n=1 Tax=Desulfotruncus alcoholivorax TaxID=265477 RepID=UPI000419607C|nr:SEC-C metal-binding domain-containing protein [Desulfotruncus alcoholivorax]
MKYLGLGFEGKLKELTDKLQRMLQNGDITKEEYDELLCFDNLEDKEMSPIDAFKMAYEKRRSIKCSKLLLEIFNQHQDNFRKAVLFSDCIPDPLSMKYNRQKHEFCLQVLKRTFKLAKLNGYSEVLLAELAQIYFMLEILNHNSINNTKMLENNQFSDFSLSEQLRMICLFIQDQQRLLGKLEQQKLKKKDFITGMEAAVADRKTDNNPNVRISAVDNFEGLLEYYDTLIRYLYYKKNEELNMDSPIEHGDITHLHIPSFELITYIAAQRVIYTVLWEKFKYSQWQLEIVHNGDEKIYVLKPKNKEEYRQHLIAGMRRNYVIMSCLYKYRDDSIVKKSYQALSDLSGSISLDNINSLYELNRDKFLTATNNCKIILKSYIQYTYEFYLRNSVKNITTEDILKCYEFLCTLADCYEMALNKNFDQENMAHYKYFTPIVSIVELSKMFSGLYDIEKDYAQKIITLFVFDQKVKGESDIFCKPLIYIAKDSILFCPTLIKQMNLGRIIEMLFLENKVNIALIGKEFENRLKSLLTKVPSIKVNTNKVEFLAYDGRNVEFDFIGTFGEYLLLFEFKALITPYSDKRLYINKEVICEGVEQIIRRSAIIQQNLDKVRSMCNISLPEKPFEDSKVIKLVVTNNFDFNTLIYKGVRIVDDSTLLKFFTNPIVKVINDRTVVSIHRLWKEEEPTVQEFLEYLENPVTTAPYTDCFKSQLKPFDRFENDYPVAIIDEVLIKDPYRMVIEEVLSQNQASKKVGRNDPCPCGSGLKYKKCCGH